MSERWLPVVGHEGAYEVSDKGRVRSSWSGGEWVRLFCNGSYFNKPGSRYRVYVICDRLGWQANVVRYGSWTTKGGYSTRACSAIGDWDVLGYGINYT